MQVFPSRPFLYPLKARIRPRTPSMPLLRQLGSGLLQALPHLALLVLAYCLYRFLGRCISRQPDLAHAHAHLIVLLEQRLGIFVEPQVQHFALHHSPLPFWGALLNNSVVRESAVVVYARSQLLWLVAMLLWVYLFRRERFAQIRDLTIVTTLLAAVISIAFPVAPPRYELAGAPYRVEDLTGIPEMMMLSLAHSGYGSMPSVHTLWALLTGLGFALGTPHLRQRVFALLFPFSMVVTVVVTGNHYFLDCAVSTALLVSCFAMQRLCQPAVDRLLSAYRPASLPRHAAPIGRQVIACPQAVQAPLLLCAILAPILLLSADPVQAVFGGALILMASAAVLMARHSSAGSRPVGAQSNMEWWSGALLIVGITLAGANDPRFHSAAAMCWFGACFLPLAARLRVFSPVPVVARSRN